MPSPGLPTVEVEVAVLEELGSENHVIFRVDAPARRGGGAPRGRTTTRTRSCSPRAASLFTARVDPRTSARVGTTVTLARGPGRLPLLRPRDGADAAGARGRARRDGVATLRTAGRPSSRRRAASAGRRSSEAAGRGRRRAPAAPRSRSRRSRRSAARSSSAAAASRLPPRSRRSRRRRGRPGRGGRGRPASCIAPMAIRSFEQMTAVGRSPFDSRHDRAQRASATLDRERRVARRDGPASIPAADERLVPAAALLTRREGKGFPGDEADPPMTQLQQVLGRHPPGRALVDADGRDRKRLRPSR